MSDGMETIGAMRADVVRLARTWIGTPYHHQASLVGVGTDCLGLVRGIYRALHGTEPEQPTAYSRDWSDASGEETMLTSARRHLCEIDPKLATAGDVLVFRFRAGCVAKHAALISGPNAMIHAVEGTGVAEVTIGSWWRRRIAGAFAFPGIVG